MSLYVAWNSHCGTVREESIDMHKMKMGKHMTCGDILETLNYQLQRGSTP